jgi:hypothetical protein
LNIINSKKIDEKLPLINIADTPYIQTEAPSKGLNIVEDAGQAKKRYAQVLQKVQIEDKPIPKLEVPNKINS